jgi:hypothetical protein
MSTSLRILDFDIENRPLAYLGQDFTTGEPTMIAACWVDDPTSLAVMMITQGDGRQERIEMLQWFRAKYDEADIVTGHYIRQHDLPVLNAAYVEHGLPKLGPKDTIDTKLDLTVTKYLSQGQENLAIMLGVAANKVHVPNAVWRDGNRLYPEAVQMIAERCVSDVVQHMAVRAELERLGYLGSPKVWRP